MAGTEGGSPEIPAGLPLGGPEGAGGMKTVVSDALNAPPLEASLTERAKEAAWRVVDRVDFLVDEARGAVEFVVAGAIQREGERPGLATERATRIVDRTAIGVAVGTLAVGVGYAAHRFRRRQEL